MTRIRLVASNILELGSKRRVFASYGYILVMEVLGQVLD